MSNHNEQVKELNEKIRYLSGLLDSYRKALGEMNILSAKQQEKICDLEKQVDISHCPDTMIDWKKRAEQLAEKMGQKDIVIAQKDAIIRELKGKLKSKQNSESERKQNDDPFEAVRRFFECLFGISCDLDKEDTQ